MFQSCSPSGNSQCEIQWRKHQRKRKGKTQRMTQGFQSKKQQWSELIQRKEVSHTDSVHIVELSNTADASKVRLLWFHFKQN
ncbi:hypothetical protein STEG23_029960, partial [Scotinomys teguina]